MLSFIGLAIRAIGAIINELSLQVMMLFGCEPIVEVEPVIFKAIFEAIKNIFAG